MSTVASKAVCSPLEPPSKLSKYLEIRQVRGPSNQGAHNGGSLSGVLADQVTEVFQLHSLHCRWEWDHAETGAELAGFWSTCRV